VTTVKGAAPEGEKDPRRGSSQQGGSRKGEAGGAVFGIARFQGPDAAGVEAREDSEAGGAVLLGDFDGPSPFSSEGRALTGGREGQKRERRERRQRRERRERSDRRGRREEQVRASRGRKI